MHLDKIKVYQDYFGGGKEGQETSSFYVIIFLPFYTVVVVFQTPLFIKQEFFKLVYAEWLEKNSKVN